MIARIKDNKYINIDQLTAGAENALIEWFSVRDPSFYKSGGNVHWDGVYRRYNTQHQRLYLPFLGELQLCCKAHNIPLEIIDERPAPKFPAPQKDQITESFIEGIKAEVYQIRAWHAACDHEIGIFSATTGSGKTEVMCGLVKMFRCPTIIITEQIVVLEQIIERLSLRNVVHNNDIGQFCFGKMPDSNIVIVGSIQSISTPKKPNKDDVAVTGKRVLKQSMDWIEKEVEWAQTGKPEDEVPHLRRALSSSTIEKLIADPDYLHEMSSENLGLLVDYCNQLEYERRMKWYKTRLKKAKAIQAMIKGKCELLIIDEADLATTQQYARLFKHIYTGRRRYGVTGTPFDKAKPVQNLFLKEHLGSIISVAKRDEVEKAGRIVPVKFTMIAVGADGDKQDGRAYDIALKEEMIENEKFHMLVAKLVRNYPDDGTLILVDTSPIQPLGEALEKMIPGSKFIFGKTKPKDRSRILGEFESRELKCLIGSKILKRGLDLSGGVENLIIIGGGAKWSDFEQKIGRALRLNKSGKSRVFGFFFLNNKYLYKHSRENLKAIVSMGYTTRVLVNGKILDGQKFIKSRFRIPRF
jgi:superfamily II DNA or RNA helicase